MEIQKNIPLLIGLAIPIILTVVIAVSVYLPTVTYEPQYDFLYVTGSYPVYEDESGEEITRYEYNVTNQQLNRTVEQFKRQPTRQYHSNQEPTFYLHDVATNTSQEISFEEAQQFALSPLSESPDGFTVTYGNRTGTILPLIFWNERDHDTRFLKKGTYSEELHVNLSLETHYPRFQFIGWVVEQSE